MMSECTVVVMIAVAVLMLLVVVIEYELFKSYDSGVVY